jgi:hypothetical protein
MRRFALVSLAALIACGLAPSALAQQKPKDPAMYSEMQNQFGRVTDALNQILTRLTALEGEVGRLKQLESDVKTTTGAVRATDQKLSDFSTGATRDLIDLKRDMTQLRSDVVSLGSEMRRSLSAQAPPQQATPAPQATPLPEGYITEVSESEVTINLGSGAGVREGMRFAVFRASDPKTEIGRISIKQVLDGNNSKAEITFKRPDVKFEFSDIVKPL